ncbi:MAG: hypothetical protein M1275_01775 [Patescibacteria group bacterium]|nr:hypothetical protein [Patescibacteria group bacterium]
MNQKLTKLALAIYDCGAFKDKSKSPEGKGFRLKLHEQHPDAPLSPVYLNLRTPDNPKPGPLTREILAQIGQLMLDWIDEAGPSYNLVAGVPNAGDPFTDAFMAAAIDSGRRSIRFLRLGKQTADDGKRQILGIQSGVYTAGEWVLVIDDLITKADSKLEAIRVLEQTGLEIAGVIVLVDREQGGADELRKAGYPFFALFTLTELLDTLVASGRINEATCQEIKDYLATA